MESDISESSAEVRISRTLTSLFNGFGQQLNKHGLSFLSDSSLLTFGIALARVLGFGFSFILARRLSPSDFGFIQYSITLAAVAAVGTQPFVQHVLARYVGKYHNDEQRLTQSLDAIWFILISITALSVLVGVPILALADRFHIGVIVIFIGVTLFYSYYGLARGFIAPRRLLVAYVGSNLMQLVAIALVYQFTPTQSPTPALFIYGLSYLLPLILLQVLFPLPLHFRWKLPNKEVTFEILRFSTPVWISHAAYVLYSGMDVLLLERYMQTTSVGLYTLTRTLTTLFSFVPAGLITILLPKAASLPEEEHFALLRKTLFIALVANGAALLSFVVSYQWFVSTFIGEQYVLQTEIVLTLAFAEILFGFHGIITAVLVGGNNPRWETVSRILIMLAGIVLGITLIPRFGLLGAGLMALGSATIGLITYVSTAFLRRRRQKSATINA